MNKGLSTTFASLILFLILACKQEKLTPSQERDEQLVNEYCLSCHTNVDPSFLPKAVWEETILPRMGHLLGVYETTTRVELIKLEGAPYRDYSQLYPEKQLISNEEWEMLKAFIIENAPDTLFQHPYLSLLDTSWITVPSMVRRSPPITTLVQGSNHGEVLVSDLMSKSMLVLKEDSLLNEVNVGSGLVQVKEIKKDYFVLQMGSFMPTNKKEGSLIKIAKEGDKSQTIIDNLERPVHMDFGDIDNDGDQDVIIAEFGNRIGTLSLYRKSKSLYLQEVLDNDPGCTKAYFEDLDQDGDLDVVALFAQGNERISAYINDGGSFKLKELISFHPSMGSTFMSLVDWDRDGDLDILYTAGDNIDYRPILKPYHGIYLFENKGSLYFEEKFHLPFDGAHKAIAMDFDNDLDMDIASISFFPDFERPYSGFAYFENNGSDSFAQKHAVNNELGRWIVMDTLDLNNDKNTDLILGSLMMGDEDEELVNRWMEDGIAYCYLLNGK